MSDDSIVKGFIIGSNYTTPARVRERRLSAVEAAKLLHTVERHRFQDELRHLKSGQGRFEAQFLHLDHPVPGGKRMLETSDGGKGAEKVRTAADPNPLWLKLWRGSYAKLPPVGKKILYALETDWRSRPAARIAGVDHKTVDEWKRKFRSEFMSCYCVWKHGK